MPRDSERIVQECPAGLVPLRRIDGRLAFEAPALLRDGPVSDEDLARVVTVLRIDAGAVEASQWLDNGPGWLGVLLGSAEAVLAVEPAMPEAWESGTLNIGIAGPYPPGSACAYEVRAIFNDDRGRLVEDPVTGSLNASLGQWLVGSGRVQAPYVASQGTVLGRTRPSAHQPGRQRRHLGRAAIRARSWRASSSSTEPRARRRVGSGHADRDGVVAARPVGCRRADLRCLHDTVAVGGADADLVVARLARPARAGATAPMSRR